MMIRIAQGRCRIAVVEKHLNLHGFGEWMPRGFVLNLCLWLAWLVGPAALVFAIRGQWKFALALTAVASYLGRARGIAARRAIVQAALDDEEIFGRLKHEGMIELIEVAPRA
jgi:hypothetical protein